MMSLLMLSTFTLEAQKKAKNDVFPEAEKGYRKVVVMLPEKKNEDSYKVEIFAGAKVEADNCNRHFMSGQITEKVLEGWGYTYYKVESDGQTGGTMMMCPDAKKTLKFVHMPPLMVRYNSKLPVVVYVPEKMEVNYRIWSAGKMQQ